MALLAGSAGAGAGASLLATIEQALAIEPDRGSTVLDAEHVVILMQENRSFDHAFGSLRGVRGFNDPRAIRLADGNPAWVQTNEAGERYVPFRLDIRETKTTWMGTLPHGWTDQVDAAHGGLHDRWLRVKKSGRAEYAAMPLTLGYHTREDLPFYYALADAFTICDQNFCSTLTGTTPNRLHLWTGTVRARLSAEAQAIVRNEDCDYGRWQNWTTFPERLEDHGVSWKIYQNELTVPTGLAEEAEAWLSNFGDNPIEWFTQFGVRFHPSHRTFLERRVREIPGEIEAATKPLPLETGEGARKLAKRIVDLKAALTRYERDLAEFSPERFEKLSPREKNLHARAFCTNADDPAYRELEELAYQEGNQTRRLNVPKGDVLHQFRQDVRNGTLPTVSWIVPPERFSDHPSSAWYGQWYLSEVLSVLTSNPAVWKKTVFILTYDENDGYYDHVPPFQAPHPQRPETGRASAGLDTAPDYLEREQDRKFKPNSALRENSLGLGFRVPMIIASPWSRGGAVCSQVFDHTSVVQFVEKLVSHKTQRKLEETNITPWRRTVCGDLMSAFHAEADVRSGLTEFVARDAFLEQIHRAQFQPLPTGFRPLTDEDLARVRTAPGDSTLPRQEPGTRRACPLPYELAVDGALEKGRTQFVIRMEARRERFGNRALGAPFIVYAETEAGMVVRHYTVAAGGFVDAAWDLPAFTGGRYRFRVHGPNGFYREFAGSGADPLVEVVFDDLVRSAGGRTGEASQVGVRVDVGESAPAVTLRVRDRAYGDEPRESRVSAGESRLLTVSTEASSGWYDLSVMVEGAEGFERRYAGRVETGRWGTSDPAMGGAPRG